MVARLAMVKYLYNWLIEKRKIGFYRKFKKLEARVLNNATSTSISKILEATKKLLKKLVY